MAARILWGHSYYTEGLPFYSIDENDIVEPAAGFLMGDWNHQYYTYGPAFMYILSLLYAAAAPLRGQSPYLFATDVFFDPSWHYYLARLLSLVIILGTLVVAVIETERLFSLGAAVLCLVLLAFPTAENFTRYTARIDVLQALFQLLALFSIIRMFDTGTRRRYVLAGVWTGLAVATKPIPGALIVPVACGVAWLRLLQEKAPERLGVPLADRVLASIGSFVADRRLYWAAAAGLGAFFVGFPFALLDFRSFWAQQVARIQADSAAAFPRGFDWIHYVPGAGWFLCVLGPAALVYHVFRGTARSRILASFAILYLLAFSDLPARAYFFVPILAPVCICISIMLADLIHRVPRLDMRLALIGALIVGLLAMGPRPQRHIELDARLAMRSWIIQNIPSGTKLCYAGWYTNGPRLVGSQIESEAANDYFMYGRDKNQHYVEGFHDAHRRYVLSGRPVYEIANWGRRAVGTPGERAQLLEFCRGSGSRYLILGGIPPFESLPDPVASEGGIFIFKL